MLFFFSRENSFIIFAGNILCGTPSMTPILQQNCPQILVCPGYNFLFPMINTAIDYDTNSWDTNVCIFWLYLARTTFEYYIFWNKTMLCTICFDYFSNLATFDKKNIVASLNSIAIIQPSPLHAIQTRSFVCVHELNTQSKLSNNSFKRNCIRQRPAVNWGTFSKYCVNLLN